MAESYTVTDQHQTVQQLAAGSVVDVEVVGFVTTKHGVHAQVVVPLKAWQEGRTHDYAQPLAHGIEHLLNEGLATGAAYVEDVDGTTGLLAGYLDFTVSYTPAHALAAMTTTVRVPAREVAASPDGEPAKLLKAALATLKHTAEL